MFVCLSIFLSFFQPSPSPRLSDCLPSCLLFLLSFQPAYPACPQPCLSVCLITCPLTCLPVFCHPPSLFSMHVPSPTFLSICLSDFLYFSCLCVRFLSCLPYLPPILPLCPSVLISVLLSVFFMSPF